MSRYRTTEEIHHFDRFKLLVLLLLLAGLLSLILFSDQLGLEPDVAGLPGTGAEIMATPTADMVVVVPDGATPEPTMESIVATPEATLEAPPMIAVPLLVAPQPGTDLTAAEVIFAGTGEPNLTLRALVDGQTTGETPIDFAGNWVLPITLAPGSPQVMLETLDESGAVVAQSGPYVFNVSGGEVLPGEGGQDVAPGVDANSGTNPFDGRFTLTGTAPAGAIVEIIVDGAPAGQTTADAQGNWTFDLVPDGGAFTVQVQVTDDSGNMTLTDPITTEDPDAAPGLDLPGLVLPNPDTGELTLTVPGGLFGWGGTGLPNTVVEVIINGQSAGTATVNDQGNWTLDLDLPPGEYTVSLVTIDPTTNQPLGSTQTVPFVVVGLPRPTVEVPADGWLSGANEISGTAAPGATLAVYVNGVSVGTVTAGPDGRWTATVELPTGESVVDVRLVDADGNVVFGSDPISVLAVGPEPTLAEVLVQAGQFNTLLAAAQATGLDGTLAGGGPYTLFAPPDQAFAALPAGTVEGWLANPAYLSTLLLHHVVPGEYSAAEAVETRLLLTAANDVLTISTEGTLARADGAAVLFPDIDASNGVVHVIDQVLLPPLPGVQAPVIDTAGVPTFTGTVLTVVGAAQPGYTVFLQVNGQPFGQRAVADPTGFWLVVDDVTPGRYEIIAYMLDPIGLLVGISDPVTLLVR
jgi:uncharacterized surface protein with fasciclin (FAS1) repeats